MARTFNAAALDTGSRAWTSALFTLGWGAVMGAFATWLAGSYRAMRSMSRLWINGTHGPADHRFLGRSPELGPLGRSA